VLLLLTVASACTSSTPTSSSTDGTSTAQSAPVKPVSGNVIKVGGIIDALSFHGADDGFKARIARANKDKELGDYTIDYLGSTDAGSAADKALSTAQDLVTRQGVYAVAPVISTGAQASFAQFMQQQQKPYFGAGFTSAFCLPYQYGLSPLGCAVNGSQFSSQNTDAIAKALGKEVKDLKWAFIGLDIPDGQATVDRFSLGVKAKGGDVVYAQAALPQGGGGDLQPAVSAVMATNPDVVIPLAGAEVLGFKTAMKNAGYSGALADFALYGPGNLDIEVVANALEGTYVVATVPTLEEGLPYAKQMQQDYTDAGGAAITFGGEYAYLSADMMIAAMKNAGPPFTSVIDNAIQGWDFTPANGAAPVSYPQDWDAAATCNTVLKTTNKTFVVAEPFSCGELVNYQDLKSQYG